MQKYTQLTYEQRYHIYPLVFNKSHINAVNQWIARYKKDGIKGLNEKPHTGRIGLFAKHSLTKIWLLLKTSG